MEYQEIFEKVRDIVAKIINLECQEINLDFPLFYPEIYDKRLHWSSNAKESNVINFKAEDSQYYFYSPVMVGESDGLNADTIICELISEFENIDFSDEVCLNFTTIKKVVDYINNHIN